MSVDRVVDRTDRNMPVTAGAAARFASVDEPVTFKGEIPVPNDLQLKVGETVQVNYADGVVTHEAVALSCTQTAIAGLPYKSGSSAVSHHEYGLSSGCVDEGQRAEGVLSSYAWPVWHQRAWGSTSVIHPGSLISWNVAKACLNMNHTLWRSTTGKGAVVVAASGEVGLYCGVG